MPENNLADPITDQEKAFVNLILSGKMNDRRAAKAVGFHPASTEHIKSKPRVLAYMLEHSAAVQHQQQTVEHDIGLPQRAVGRAGEGQLIPSRDQILARLWEIATLSSEITRGSITGQIKAISMIIAIEGFIPDRRAAGPPPSQKDSAPAPTRPQPGSAPPVPPDRGAQQENEPACPKPWDVPGVVPEPKLTRTPGAVPSHDPGLSHFR